MLVDGAASTGSIYLRRFHDERQLIAREAQDRGDGAIDLVGRTRHHGEASNGAQTSRQESDGRCESFIGIAVPVVVHYLDASSPEAARRRRLADTDQLLTDIEELRLEAGHSLSAFCAIASRPPPPRSLGLGTVPASITCAVPTNSRSASSAH